MRTVLKRALTTAAALSLAAASGCAFFEQEEPDLDPAEYEQQLTETYNESVRLNDELDVAEDRITEACMEAQGFTEHDPGEFVSFGDEERETYMDTPPYRWFLPSAEDAARRGFWQWTEFGDAESVEDGDALYAEWEEFQTEMGWVTVDFGGDEDEEPEFYSLPEADQYAWYVAYGGQAWAEYMHPELAGLEVATDPDDQEAQGPPPAGGCKLETLEAVYGEIEEGTDEYSVRPEQPDGDWTAMTERYEEGTGEFEGAFLDCLSELDRDGWEFYEGQILVHDYLVAAGEGEYALSSYPDAGTRWPDPPSDVPEDDDVQGWLDFERDLAVDFAECGDDSGYREAAAHAWEQAQLRYYLDIEGATFAWQDQMRELIEQAQEAIAS